MNEHIYDKTPSDHKLINLTKKYNLEFIPYNQFTNVTYIAKGGFSKIYKAIWEMGKSEVVLKIYNYYNDIYADFSNELNINFQCRTQFSDLYFQKIYGITRDPESKKYIIVMEFALYGDLHCFLNSKKTLTLRGMLEILNFIVWDLMNLHKKNIIHCDFHSGNILINKDSRFHSPCAKITDFGRSKLVNATSNRDVIYGIIPYVAPEVLRGEPYTKQSDIYSLGMIIWEMTSGHKPFYDREHDTDLILAILDGLRPDFIDDTPKELVELIKKCWDNDVSKRPKASDIKFEINQTLKNNENEPVLSKITFSYIEKICSRTIYQSRLLSSFVSSALALRNLHSNVTESTIININSLSSGYISREIGLDVLNSSLMVM
ncbi:2300_t:CDS:2 [Cetraspora pellucida]|uniref:2300_t:CDS:1 n=1 Tax=Cetraspora pellucida TaxID=1433469 RepID=A0A9N9C8C5_9GLOM|nr:2300_t:CDS:2 [Cetraspora pellucida]